MQTDMNEMKVEKSVGMHSHAFERPCKHQKVTDTKSRNASQMFFMVDCLVSSNYYFRLRKKLCLQSFYSIKRE